MTGPDEDDLLAGELALGLLEGPERSEAEARAEADPAFAALVEAWRERLAPMLTASPEAPPEHIWDAIQAQLAVNDKPAPSDAERALRRWRAFAVASSALAASLALVLVTRSPPPQAPPPRVEAPIPNMVATLEGEQGLAIVTIAADPAGRLLVTPVRLPAERGVPELWIIPEDGKPRSLGIIRAEGPSAMIVAPGHRPHVHRDATFAISREPAGGSPTGLPTGPVIASGKISIV